VVDENAEAKINEDLRPLPLDATAEYVAGAVGQFQLDKDSQSQRFPFSYSQYSATCDAARKERGADGSILVRAIWS